MGLGEPVSLTGIPFELSCSDLAELSSRRRFRACLPATLADSSAYLEQIYREMGTASVSIVACLVEPLSLHIRPIVGSTPDVVPTALPFP